MGRPSGAKQASVPPVVPISIPTPPLAAPTKPLPKKVLMVLPQYGLWYGDYHKVRAALAAENIELVTASSDTSKPCTGAPGSENGATWGEILLTEPGSPDEFGAVIFVGANTTQYHPGPGVGDCVGKLIDAFLKRGRFVTAICLGQDVLAAHGTLRGKQVASSSYAVQANAYEGSGANLTKNRVVRDGQIITAAAEFDAERFVAEIAAALRER
jgi:putative intracellular protease/amidase